MSLIRNSKACCSWKSVFEYSLVGMFGALSVALIAASLFSDVLATEPVTLAVEDIETPEPAEPVLAAASGDGLAAISSFKYPGLKCELFAAEPQVGNIIAIHRDYQGKLFVCETYRQGKAIEDNRNHSYWLDDDLQAQTVQDRIDYILKHHPDAKETYTKFDDRIRVLADNDNDGKADIVKVFANRFNALEMGSGAGVLSYRGNVYYTCIPDLFVMKDTDGDMVSDERKSLSTGYGVRFAFRGHDSHGLIVDPTAYCISASETAATTWRQTCATQPAAPCSAANSMGATSKFSQPACVTHKSSPLMTMETCLPETTIPMAATRRVGLTLCPAAILAGECTFSISAIAARGIAS